jgi:hypothetical protein
MKLSHSLRGIRAWVLFRSLLFCLLGAFAGLALAAPPTQIWQAVSDRKLDTQRGGFSFGGRLEVSFGITRSVFINGELITETVLNIAHLADITPAWAARLREELQSITLVQNGPGNTFVSGGAPITSPSGAPPSAASAQTNNAVPVVITADTMTASSMRGTAAGTVIQNTLNNQQILHQTIINASSNGLGMLRLMSLQSTLSETIRQSVGLR